MKKFFCFILALAVLLCSMGAVLADDPDEIPGTVEIPYAGIRFVPPESFRNPAGQVVYDGYDSLGPDNFYAVWYYCAMTEEELAAIFSGEKAMDESTPIVLLFYVFVVGGGDFDSLNELTGNVLQKEYAHEIGKAGDYTFYLYLEPVQEFADAIDTPYREEYQTWISQPELLAAAFTCYEPLDLYADLIGKKVEFTTTDLDGNPVSSADLFAQNEITMVNIWATWCGPCIGELAELQAIHTRLQEKGCGIVGLLGDVSDPSYPDEARSLVAENGVEYPVILAPDNFYDLFPVNAWPTSFFINRNGEIMAAPIVGAYVNEYEPTLEELLDVQ